jgi:hypothetical protein
MLPFKAMAQAANSAFDSQRPWPFFHLYDAWFQSFEDFQRPAFAGLRVTQLAGQSGTATPVGGPRGRSTRSDDPTKVALWRKRGQPAMMLRRDARGGEVAFNPSMFSLDLVTEIVDGYQLAVRALVEKPDARLRDVGLV